MGIVSYFMFLEENIHLWNEDNQTFQWTTMLSVMHVIFMYNTFLCYSFWKFVGEEEWCYLINGSKDIFITSAKLFHIAYAWMVTAVLFPNIYSKIQKTVYCTRIPRKTENINAMDLYRRQLNWIFENETTKLCYCTGIPRQLEIVQMITTLIYKNTLWKSFL